MTPNSSNGMFVCSINSQQYSCMFLLVKISRDSKEISAKTADIIFHIGFFFPLGLD